MTNVVAGVRCVFKDELMAISTCLLMLIYVHPAIYICPKWYTRLDNLLTLIMDMINAN